MVVLSRVIVDADSVQLTARGVSTLCAILSSASDVAVVHAGNHSLYFLLSYYADLLS